MANVAKSVFENNRAAVNTYLSRVYYGNKTPYYPDAAGDLEDFVILPKIKDFMFSVVFDYGEFDQNGIGFSTDLNEDIIVEIDESDIIGTGWPCRNDAFSNFRAGFEIRTYRRCNRIMQFHHFIHELGIGNYLVKSMELVYEHELLLQGIDSSAEGYSFLKQIVQKGHQLNNHGIHYLSECLPPLNFTYQTREWNNEVKTMAPEDMVHAPIGLGQNYQWTDLYSEGISGVLTEQGTGWFYKSNMGEGKFSNAQLVYPRPSSTGLGSGALSLQELEGNGVKYLVDYNSNNKGFFKLTPEEEWEPFRYFEAGLPNRNFNDANAKFIDLNGDGLPDLMISEDSAFLWYESNGEKGFKEAYKVNKPFDEDFGPAILFNDVTQSIQLADMSGDGLTDIVRIKNGEVCYWPNLGFGKFGSKIVMESAPIFDYPDTFNPKYIRLADIDGSGTTDIVYLRNGKASVWLNNCGNSFNENPFTIDNLPQLNTATEVSIIDFLGNGTSCFVYSSSLPAHKEQAWKYIDLMGGKKPHLMTMYSNSMGKEVRMDYKSSTFFYLKDKAAGKPWVTKLPFAVHVLTKLITQDTVTKTRLVNEYSFHHGYYDYEEREFRGFGRVEQKDIESITENNELDLNIASQLDQAPILIKSWYHTGAYIRSKKMLDHYADEYYQNNVVAEHTLPGAIIDWASYTTHNADDIRQAHRACKGMMLRQEVYALENINDSADTPISTTKQNCYVKQLQPRGTSLYPVFIALESEKIGYQYEQMANDPRITHSILLQVNEYGQTLLNASIAYPRIDNESSFTQDQQKAMRVIISEQQFTTAVNDFTTDLFHYCIPMPAQSKTWEVRKDIAVNTYYSKADFENFETSFAEVAYHESIAANNRKRLIEHSYITYLDDSDNVTELDLFEPNKRGNIYQQYQLAFNDDLLSEVFDTHDGDVGTLAENNGFIKDIENRYWLPSGRAVLTDVPPTDFYLPESFIDALGGSKASFLITQKTGVIVGALNFNSTEHDSKTLPKAIEQYERLTSNKAKNIFLDRGYRGPKCINQTNICVPVPDKNISRAKRKGHSRRAAIEPVIGHLKQNYRMSRNYLKGILGDELNIMLAAAAMNFKRVMNLWKTEAIYSWKLTIYLIMVVYKHLFAQKLKMTF